MAALGGVYVPRLPHQHDVLPHQSVEQGRLPHARHAEEHNGFSGLQIRAQGFHAVPRMRRDGVDGDAGGGFPHGGHLGRRVFHQVGLGQNDDGLAAALVRLG
jgi:hypothetical protein